MIFVYSVIVASLEVLGIKLYREYVPFSRQPPQPHVLSAEVVLPVIGERTVFLDSFAAAVEDLDSDICCLGAERVRTVKRCAPESLRGLTCFFKICCFCHGTPLF